MLVSVARAIGIVCIIYPLVVFYDSCICGIENVCCITYAQDTYNICEKAQYVSETDSTINKNMIRSFVHHTLVFYETHIAWTHDIISVSYVLFRFWAYCYLCGARCHLCRITFLLLSNTFVLLWKRMCVFENLTPVSKYLHVCLEKMPIVTLVISGVTVHVSSYVTTYVSHL